MLLTAPKGHELSEPEEGNEEDPGTEEDMEEEEDMEPDPPVEESNIEDSILWIVKIPLKYS